MLLVLVVPGWIALGRVVQPRPLEDVTGNPTPLGYTWSLLMFAVPCVLLGAWYARRRSHEGVHALGGALLLLFSLGVVLDLVFGNAFFTFVNRAATLGIQVPALGGSVPLEEFGFYSLGFGAILLTYLWLDEDWMRRYRPHVHDPSRRVPLSALVRVHRGWVVFGALAFAAAIAYKKLGPHDWREGFPGYLAFLLVVGVLPPIVLFDATARYVNWRALGATVVLLLPVSLLWEGVLGVPYQWWGYKPEQMVGLRLEALSDLPIEEPLLWLVVAFAGVLVYEAVRLHRGLSLGDAGPARG